MPIIPDIAAAADEMTAWRRHLHQHPELMFDTVETAAFVAERLREFGVDELHEKVAQNGVIGVIEGRGAGPVIGLRADMDALPIIEETGLEYASKQAGVMHACGHDGHMATLLGAAKYLARTRNFTGRVVLIFQPAEEGGGGAQVMCEEGVLEKFGIEKIFALHNWPGLPEGEIHLAEGGVMAAADVFEVVVRGKGAHAAQPHLAIDPIQITVQIITALQQVVARKTDPFERAVLSVTRIQAGTANNIIPEEAVFGGTFRTLSAATRNMVMEEMRRIVPAIANGLGGEAVLHIDEGYPVTVNDAQAVAFAAKVGTELLGADKVFTDAKASMGAEDFSFFLNERPGAYMFLGAGERAGLHHPKFNFNDALLPVGASWFAGLVEMGQPLKN